MRKKNKDITKIIVYIYPKNLQLQVSFARFHVFCR